MAQQNQTYRLPHICMHLTTILKPKVAFLATPTLYRNKEPTEIYQKANNLLTKLMTDIINS